MRWYGMSPEQEYEFKQLYESMAYPHRVLKFARKVNPALSEKRFWQRWTHMNFVVLSLKDAQRVFLDMVNPRYKESE